MTKLVIGLFDDYTTAEQVVKDLTNSGFSENDMLVSGYSVKGRHDTVDDHHKLAKRLEDEGVPPEETEYYAEGVRRGGTLITVTAADDKADVAADIMRRYEVVDLDSRVDFWREQGWTGYDPAATAYTTEQVSTEKERRPAADVTAERLREDEARIPVTEEELKVGKRAVRSGGVRVHSRIIEKPVEERVALREEHVEVERRPVNRPLSDAEKAAAFKEGVIEAEEYREEAVVSKEARVVEEVVVNKGATQHEETIRDTVRHTDVEVEKTGGHTATAATTGSVSYDDDFRNHYQTHYADRGDSYDNYRKAYEYGYGLDRDSRYKSKDWSAIESQVKSEWEGRNPNTWTSYKDPVRYGWEKSRANR